MLKLRSWLSSLLVLAITATPVVAENNDAKTANSNAASTASADASPAAASPNPSPNPSPSLNINSTTTDSNVTALLGVLVMKGVLAPSEANAIRNAAPTAQFQALVEALSRKGLLNASDLATAATPAPRPSAPAAAPEAAVSTSLESVEAEPSLAGQPAPAVQGTPPPPPPAVIPAVAPLRVLASDPPKRDGLVPAFKMGPVKMTPYGFIKATAVHDSSDPNGDDFPFVGLFLTSTSALSTGPTKDPEFHIKARSTRIGANLEWPDSSPKLTFTGRIEGDYEGNFSEVDNRDVSSIRSNSFQLRLAYVRMDYAMSDKTDVFFEGGQDWTLFGSTALPNILETTFLCAYYGCIWERSPQFMVGAVQKLGNSSWNFKLDPTFAIMMPSTGQIEKLAGTLAGFEGQIGQGEREGADADRPEYEGRLALQFQLDKAPGVAPAQIFWSGFHSRRASIVPTSAYDSCTGGANPLACSLQAAFPNGFQSSSKQYGNQLAVQLPTRWFTLVASAYKGGDLRFFFGGQVNGYVTDQGGLSGLTSYVPLDGVVAASGSTSLGCNVALVSGVCPSTANVVVAPEHPVRSFGGFVNLGLPLSRWFNADPKGHNAGWQLYLHAGKDQVVDRDITNPNFIGALPLSMGKMFAATLYYKVNPWCTFAIEQSNYATRLDQATGAAYSIAGKASNEWEDNRTEFGPVFTF
jgi:hypothetical protein